MDGKKCNKIKIEIDKKKTYLICIIEQTSSTHSL